MKTYVATLESVSPYSQSKFYSVPRLEKEKHNEYEDRTWMNRISRDDKGNIVIQPMAFKKSFEAAAKYDPQQIGSGRGKATYTKHIVSGVLITDYLYTGKTLDDVVKETFLVSSTGKKEGHDPKVPKHFPMITSWKGDLTIYVLDEIINKDYLTKVITDSGRLSGLADSDRRTAGSMEDIGCVIYRLYDKKGRNLKTRDADGNDLDGFDTARQGN